MEELNFKCGGAARSPLTNIGGRVAPAGKSVLPHQAEMRSTTDRIMRAQSLRTQISGNFVGVP